MDSLTSKNCVGCDEAVTYPHCPVHGEQPPSNPQVDNLDEWSKDQLVRHARALSREGGEAIARQQAEIERQAQQIASLTAELAACHRTMERQHLDGSLAEAERDQLIAERDSLQSSVDRLADAGLEQEETIASLRAALEWKRARRREMRSWPGRAPEKP